MGLTGQEVTAVLGTPVVADMTVGMTGLDLTYLKAQLLLQTKQ